VRRTTRRMPGNSVTSRRRLCRGSVTSDRRRIAPTPPATRPQTTIQHHGPAGSPLDRGVGSRLTGLIPLNVSHPPSKNLIRCASSPRGDTSIRAPHPPPRPSPPRRAPPSPPPSPSGREHRPGFVKSGDRGYSTSCSFTPSLTAVNPSPPPLQRRQPRTPPPPPPTPPGFHDLAGHDDRGGRRRPSFLPAAAAARPARPPAGGGRGFHSSTFQIKLSCSFDAKTLKPPSVSCARVIVTGLGREPGAFVYTRTRLYLSLTQRIALPPVAGSVS